MKFLYIHTSQFQLIWVFSPPKHLSLTQNFIPKGSSTLILFFFIGKVINPFLHHAFHISDLTFGIFLINLGIFQKILSFCEIFGTGFYLNDFKSSCIALHLHYNNVSCILDVCLPCCYDCLLVGLDWAELMMNLYLHVTCSCIFMHTHL